MRTQPVQARPGFLLVEALIGIVLFGIFLGSVGVSFLASFNSSIAAGDRMEGTMLAQQALEGALSMRDASFSSLSAGTYGVVIKNGVWAYSGSSVRTSDGFATAVTVSSVSSGLARATAKTTWNNGQGRSGSVLLGIDISDWRSTKTQGNWLAPVQKGSYVDAGTPLFQNAVRYGNYLFVGSDRTSGGAGLYVFDITSESAPARVASSFNLGASCLGLSLRGSKLYVLTDDSSTELRVYDVSSPTSFSSSNLVTTYDLPGSGLGLSTVLNGKMLYVGAKANAGTSQLYSFVTSTDGILTLSGSLVDTGGINALSVRGNTVYAADTDNTSELRVIDVSVAGSPRLVTGSGVNLTDTLDGSAVAVNGTGVVLGRLTATATEELVLFDVSTLKVPASSWVFDLGDSVRAIAADSAGKYAFVASDAANKEFTVIDLALMRQNQNPQVALFHSTQGLGRGLTYDAWKDRVYLLTNKAVYILGPT